MKVVSKFVAWYNNLNYKQINVITGFVVILGMVGIALFSLPKARTLDAIQKSQQEQKEDIKKLGVEVNKLGTKITKIEKDRQDMLAFTKGRIGFEDHPPEVKKDLKYRYRKYIQTNLGGMPKVKLYWVKPMLNVPKAELHCLAKNIYHEAAREPISGQLAVGIVTLNRFTSGEWGSICDTVYAKGQFSWTIKMKGQDDTPPPGKKWEKAKRSARNVTNGLRVEGLEKATFYHADYIYTPLWVKDMKVTHFIGRHLMYNEIRKM